MLPDFPLLKRDLGRAITRWQERRTRMYQGEIGKIQRAQVFEGDRNVIVRTDGSLEETSYISSSAKLIIPASEAEQIDLPELLMKLDPIAEDMARQQSRGLYEAIVEGVEKVGNSVDAQGQRLSPELFLRCLERVIIPFDREGSPLMPKLHVHPALGAEAEKAWKELHETPELSARFQEIINKKRDEWNAGEASRVLVG